METSLYQPVKTFLEAAGYAVKGEVHGCDLVGLSSSEPPVVVICELKLSFNLELILQAVDRAAVSDEVWIAARVSAKGRGREADRRYRDLCRRLGIGMLGVSDRGEVSIIVSSVSPMPRTNPKRRTRLVREHQRRRGDPARGGSTRTPIMTAYRQQALACAESLLAGPLRPRGYQGTGAGCRQDPAEQCLWLVRACAAGALSAYGAGQGCGNDVIVGQPGHAASQCRASRRMTTSAQTSATAQSPKATRVE